MTTRRARTFLVAGLAGLLSLSCGAGPVVCPELNASKLRLVTFDVFGALMQTQADLRRSVGEALPALSSDVAALVAGDMVSSYAGYMDSGGFVFDSGVHTPQPFVWVTRTGLASALAARAPACGAECAPGGAPFERLATWAWGNLTPYADVTIALSRVALRYEVGVLSNGDDATLGNATQQFEAAGVFARRFGSDYPVGVFKPQHAIYDQILQHGFAVDEVLHVAGGELDAVAAHSAGFLSAVGRGGGGGGSPSVCFFLADLSELPDVLGLPALTPSLAPSPSPGSKLGASGAPAPSATNEQLLWIGVGIGLAISGLSVWAISTLRRRASSSVLSRRNAGMEAPVQALSWESRPR